MFINYSLLLISAGPALTSAGLLPNWVLSTRADSDICAVKGNADPNNLYFQSESSSLTSYSGCSARCAGQSRCQSFGVDEGNVCMLFDEPLSGNYRAKQRSDLILYDAGCVDDGEETTAPSATAVPTTSSPGRTQTARATATRTTFVPRPTTTPTTPTQLTPTDTSGNGSFVTAIAASTTDAASSNPTAIPSIDDGDSPSSNDTSSESTDGSQDTATATDSTVTASSTADAASSNPTDSPSTTDSGDFHSSNDTSADTTSSRNSTIAGISFNSTNSGVQSNSTVSAGLRRRIY